MATEPEIGGDLVRPASSEQHTPSSLAESSSSSSSICRPNPKIERALYEAIRGQIDGIIQSLSSREREDLAKFEIKEALQQLEDLKIDGHVDGTEEEEENRLITRPQIRPELRKLVKFVMKYESSSPYIKYFDPDSVHNDDDIERNLGIPPEVSPEAVHDIIRSLEEHLRRCLLCFSVFPENTIIKKRVMLYWWIGEGFVSATDEKTAEEFANECFGQLIKKKLIEPIYRLHNMAVDGCKVPHFVRSALITFAQRDNFFHFDSISTGGRNPAAVMAQLDFSDFTCACLLRKGGLSKSIHDLKKLRTLFNLNQCLVEVDPKWISNMTNIRILYLGRWQKPASTSFHEVQGTDTDFLNKWLENTSNCLSFLSLQGIYGITELPALSKMQELVILDLRDCYTLEVLPGTISELKNLTHLDMSECYLLDHMPKGISLLLKLQVLKGFVIGGSKRNDSSCNLDDLAGLKEMRKLNIRAVKNGFPNDKELNALQKFTALRKLKIEWEEVTSKESTRKLNRTLSKLGSKLHDSKPNTTISKLLLSKLHDSKQKNKSISLVQALPAQLVKLDLHCFPQRTLPKWLMPSNLKNLKKLYIRGGQLRSLNVPESDEWTVEILRLKYLAELEMDWMELRKLFPKLICSETVHCASLSDELWKAEQLN